MPTISAERKWLLGLTLMSALIIACYIVAMNAYWVGDDFNYVRPKSLAEVANYFNPVGRAQFRPLTWTTWSAGFFLFGADPLGYHLARLAQHIWNAVWIALLIRAIFKRSDIALIAATLFAIHPAQPQTVTWLGGQADASFAMFWLPALWLFVRWRQGIGGRGLWLLFGLLGFLSMFGKEAAVTLPIMGLWIDLIFGREWARWPGKKTSGWWRDPSTLLGLLRDHSLFIGAAALYVGLRIVLFLTGQGRLMYGADQLGFFSYGLDVVVGYIILALGFWWLPPAVGAWPALLKLTILLITLVSVGLLLRWLGRKGIFALGWFAITLLLTLQAVALRWFYLPALTLALLIALIYAKLTTQDSKLKSSQLGIALVIIFTAWFGGQTIAHNVQWQESGEQARGILAQVKQLHPNPTLPATFYVANPPYSYKDVLLFNTGMDAAIFHVYNDWTNIKSYSLTEDIAQIQSALTNPNMIGPNPIFLRYENGKIVEYPDLQSLKAAGP